LLVLRRRGEKTERGQGPNYEEREGAWDESKKETGKGKSIGRGALPPYAVGPGDGKKQSRGQSLERGVTAGEKKLGGVDEFKKKVQLLPSQQL